MIKDLIKNKTPKQKATIKGKEIAKIDFSGEYISQKYGVKIDIQNVKAIEGGIEVFAKAWRKNKQLGFGKDGSVEIERFLIYNPPILVSDPNGTILREWTNKNGILHEYKYIEDLAKATRQDLAHTISLVGKENTNVTRGKTGNTTTTFRPAAGTNSPVDGSVGNSGTVYATVHDAGTGATATPTNTAVSAEHDKQGTDFIIERIITLFDTSSLGTDTIDSAVYSLEGNAKNDTLSDSARVVTSNPASNSDIVTSDYDFNDFGTTALAPDKTVASWSTSAFNDYTLNATGEATIDKGGITKIGLRMVLDVNDTSPSPAGSSFVGAFMADQGGSGTTQDPKLVVEHTAVSAEPAIFFGNNF